MDIRQSWPQVTMVPVSSECTTARPTSRGEHASTWRSALRTGYVRYDLVAYRGSVPPEDPRHPHSSAAMTVGEVSATAEEPDPTGWPEFHIVSGPKFIEPVSLNFAVPTSSWLQTTQTWRLLGSAPSIRRPRSQ